MKKLLYLFFIASTGFMVGCQPTDNENPMPAPSAKKVVKITMNKADQKTVTNLTYDANGRLATSQEEGSTSNTTYTYNSAGDLAKIETVDGTHKTVFEVNYSDGVPAKSTLKLYDGDGMYSDSEFAYTVVNRQVTRIIETLEGTPWLISDITYSGANVAKIATTHVTGDPSFAETVEYTYDNKNNFFSQNGFAFLLDAQGLTLPFFAKNNILNEKHVGNSEHTYEIVNSYTYDAEGYPLTVNAVKDGLIQFSTNFKFDYQ